MFTLSATLVACLAGSGCDPAGVPDAQGTTGGDGVAAVTVQLGADFGADAAGKPRAVRAKELCPTIAPAMDGPMYQGEQDCDGGEGLHGVGSGAEDTRVWEVVGKHLQQNSLRSVILFQAEREEEARRGRDQGMSSNSGSVQGAARSAVSVRIRATASGSTGSAVLPKARRM